MSENKRWDFFKDGDTAYGVFYPEHYTVAAFPDVEAARAAGEAAIAAGYAAEDVRAVDGAFMAGKLESQSEASLLDRVKAKIAQAVGTEVAFIELDRQHARRGAGFLFVYTPEEADGDRVEALLRSRDALYARRYLPLAIERLIEPPRLDD
ncbi:MAG: hypothetical protein ACXIUZ_10295 [Lysobacteraceae bacterium]